MTVHVDCKTLLRKPLQLSIQRRHTRWHAMYGLKYISALTFKARNTCNMVPSTATFTQSSILRYQKHNPLLQVPCIWRAASPLLHTLCSGIGLLGGTVVVWWVAPGDDADAPVRLLLVFCTRPWAFCEHTSCLNAAQSLDLVWTTVESFTTILRMSSQLLQRPQC